MKTTKIIGLAVCFTLFLALGSIASAEDAMLRDGECDVYIITDQDFADLTEGSVAGYGGLSTTCKPDADIRKIECTKIDEEITITLQVYGEINDGTDMTEYEENFGGLDENASITDILNLPDILITTYNIQIKTTADDYYLIYQLGNAEMYDSDGENTTVDFEKKNDIITFTSELKDASEEIEDINASTLFMEGSYISIILGLFSGGDGDSLGLGDIGSFKTYSDVVPNPGFSAFATASPDEARVNEEIQFNATTDLGEAPYQFKWDFGDEDTSSVQNPTHKYSKEDIYKVNLTVTDSVGNTTAFTLDVNISNQANSAEQNNKLKDDKKDDGLFATVFGENSGLVPFIVLVAIILVAGLSVLYYISKR